MTYRVTIPLRIPILLSVCWFTSGCGSSDGLVPVEGTVTLDGKPLAAATVVLHPVTAAGSGPYLGTTDSEGKFSLSSSASPGESGAMPGDYRLSISTLKVAPMPEGDDTAKPKVLAPEQVPDEYRVGNMRFEVPAGGTSEANFEVSGR